MASSRPSRMPAGHADPVWRPAASFHPILHGCAQRCSLQGKAIEVGSTLKSGADTLGRIYSGFLRIAHCSLPTVAAVNGAAMGAGCDLACMCDIRVAGETTQFAESFVKLGIIPGDGGAWFLPRAVGRARAAEMSATIHALLRLNGGASDGAARRSARAACGISATSPRSCRNWPAACT